MSADVINLRQARKQREREARVKQAEENRVKHGRKKVEREQTERQAKTQAELLDGHWLDQPAENSPGHAADDDGTDQDKP
ncbi:MAG: hypothetical protein ACI89J_000038 [Hyphomicrobiaceae bacterium]|jgi:hypothetical protein